MLCLKKAYNDELFQLTLILSLLRIYPNSYFDPDPYISTNSYEFGNGTSWQLYTPSVTRFHHTHVKSLDTVLLNYESEVFADLNSLGGYNRINLVRNSNITAYLLNVDCDSNCNINSSESPPHSNRTINEERSEGEASGGSPSEPETPTTSVIDLTQEDMDLIEILWKQDVDLGFSMDMANEKSLKQTENVDIKKSLSESTTSTTLPEDDIEKLKTLEAVNNHSLKTEENSSDANELDDIWAGLSYTIDTETGEYILKGGLNNNLPLAEYDSPLPLGDLPLPEYLLDEALQFVGLNEDSQEIVSSKESPSHSTKEDSSSAESVTLETANTSTLSHTSETDLNSKDFDSDEELNLLTDMIQTAQFHHPTSRAFQSRMPFVRTMSIEQRWQDLANLLSIPAPGDGGVMSSHIPFPHHHPALHNYNHAHGPIAYGHDSTRSVLLHNATLNPPIGEINGTGPYTSIGSGTNLGSAVATSMNLANSTEPMGDSNCAHYKLDTPHEMLYYPNPPAEMNQTTEGFLSSILNDEDLQLMDLAMNEGMYTMRVLDGANNSSNISSVTNVNGGSSSMARLETEKMDASSDSALSSMGSERVPSLSDGEWCDAGSDSGHTPADYVDYHSSKYRPYDYSYNNRQPINSVESTDRTRITPVPQKKHQMFGKRYLQEQGTSTLAQPQTPIKYEYGNPAITSYHNGQPRQPEPVSGNKASEIKYSCTVEFARHLHSTRSSMEHVQHNHTYHLPAESTGAMQRPISRDKHKNRKAEEEHLTRDEKRARALSVPLTVQDIINLPMDEFNERLSKYDLNEPQLTLIRDIRRRGKNKVAAQNCRKRKLDQILSLADEVRDMRDRKHRLISERDFMISERQRVKDKFAQLYRHIFENLRDPDGNHYSPYQYSLQQSADGSVLVVPRANSSITDQERKEPHSNCKK